MTVVEENGYRPPGPGRRQNQVDGMISVDVLRFDQESARRAYESNRLRLRCAQIDLNPVIRRNRIAPPWLNAREIGTKIVVEVGHCEGQTWAR
jgi:hypothetical protein